MEFLSILDAALVPLTLSKDVTSQASKDECQKKLDEARSFLKAIAEKDGTKNRAASLATTELGYRAFKHGLSGVYCFLYIILVQICAML